MRIATVLLASVLLFGCSEDGGTAGGGTSPDPGEIVMLQIDAGGFTFDARAAGPAGGELVLLLHGFPETSYEWRAQLVALGEAGYRAVAPDQRGYSPTARPTNVSDYAVPLLIGDALAMADALGADEFHVVGHDWGAAVAWGLAGVAPARVRTLTTLSIPHPDAFAAELADMTSCQYQASSYFDLFQGPGAEALFLDNDAALLKSLYGDLSQDAIDEYVAALGTEEALGAALNWYRANIVDRQFTTPPLGAVTVPTLFVWSDADTAVCPEGAQNTGDHVTGAYQFETLAGIGHWIPELAPAEVNALLLAHVAN